MSKPKATDNFFVEMIDFEGSPVDACDKFLTMFRKQVLVDMKEHMDEGTITETGAIMNRDALVMLLSQAVGGAMEGLHEFTKLSIDKKIVKDPEDLKPFLDNALQFVKAASLMQFVSHMAIAEFGHLLKSNEYETKVNVGIMRIDEDTTAEDIEATRKFTEDMLVTDAKDLPN